MKRIAPISSDLVWARTAGGNIQVSLDDHIGRSIYFCGDLDPKISWILRKILHKGDRVLDIGANYGLLTLLMSELVGQQGMVHAFEPNPNLCRVMETTVAYNRVTNVTLHPFALGATDGEMELHVPLGNLGAASLVRKMGQAAQVYRVPVKMLDDIMLRERISTIKLIKIDVEGFELEVLKGALRILQEIRPSVILFESNENYFHAKVTPVMKLLQEYGYEFIMIPQCLIRMRTQVVDLNRPGEILGHDLIAAPRGNAFLKLCKQLRAT